MKLLLRLLGIILRGLYKVFPIDKWYPIPLCDQYHKYGLDRPPFVGHTTAPSLTTGSASSITSSSFTMGGTIDSTGNENPSTRGFCYVSGSGGTPTTSNSTVSTSGSYSTGSYSQGISGLAAGTTYSVRAYAINSAGTGYGSTVEVTTLTGIPTVTTGTSGSVTSTTATISTNNVSTTNGGTINSYGVVWNTTGTPTISDNKAQTGTSFTTGNYNTNLTGLPVGTLVYFRAYATTSQGTGYGSTGSFTTLSNTPPTVALDTADSSSFSTATPTLSFTGTDSQSDDVRYQMQIHTTDSFMATVDSYSESNQDTTVAMFDNGAFNQPIHGQVFHGIDSKLGSAKFYLQRAGTVTGNVYAKLYASTGTYGSSATPTGSTLATSNAIVGSDISTSLGLVEFTFSGSEQYLMSSSSDYFIVVESLGGTDSSNSILVGIDFSSPTHSGNPAQYQSSSTWLAQTSHDICFYVYSVPFLDKLSGTDSGFSGSPDNTDPFTSGQQVSYTTTSLSDGTYYWRVRGKDPSGSNTYGAWSSTRSFTVSTGGGTTGQIKVYNGSSFVAKPVKVWNGSSWVTKPVKRWNGSSWVTTTY